jgi:hypothetical protein
MVWFTLINCYLYFSFDLLLTHSLYIDGDETAEQRSTKFAEKVRRHALSSSALQGLKEEFMDTPVEIVESTANASKQSIVRERQERQE